VFWKDACRLVEAVHRLTQLGARVKEDDEHVLSDRDWGEVADLSIDLLDNVHIHNLPPGVMGKGRTKLEDKMSTGTFMNYLDVGDSLQASYKHTGSWTTDGGTEFGINNYQSKGGELHSIFPLLKPDADIEVDDGGALPGAGADCNSDLEMEGDCAVVGGAGGDTSAAAADDSVEDELAPDHGFSDAAPAAPDFAGEPPPLPEQLPLPEGDHIFPISIRVMGPMHILDNALDDCWEVLLGFKEYKLLAVNVLRLLGRVAARERFVNLGSLSKGNKCQQRNAKRCEHFLQQCNSMPKVLDKTCPRL